MLWFIRNLKFSSTFYKRWQEIQKGGALLPALRRERNFLYSENAGKGEKTAQWAVLRGNPRLGFPLVKLPLCAIYQ